MYKKRKILGLIPARGGSKGLRKKNIKPLLGKPLVAWTIEQALASKYIDDVVVSTDDKEIATIAKRHGASVPFMRPARLASDSSTSIEVVFHALEYLKGQAKEYDYIALLEPTSPLRKEDDLDNALKALIDSENKADSLVSLGKIALEHPIYAKKLSSQGYLAPYFKADRSFSRRQDLPVAYFPYGVIYLSKISTLKEAQTFYQKRTIAYLLERWQNYEVDDIYDFACIGQVLKTRKGRKI